MHRTISSSRQWEATIDGIVVSVAFSSRGAMAAVPTRRDDVNANADATPILRPLEPDSCADAAVCSDCAVPASTGTTGITPFNERVQRWIVVS